MILQKKMRNIIRIIFLAMCTCLPAMAVPQAPDSVLIDQTVIESREMPDETISEFLEDDDFDYALTHIPGKSILEMIRDWFRNLLAKLSSVRVGDVNIINIFIYTICILAASYAIYKLIEMKSRKIVSSSKDDSLPYDIHAENIHEMNFEELIQEASAEGQYRRGIRLIYLYALKKLSDSQKITWEAGKTNHEYLTELGDEHLKPGFGTLSYYFDYAWYGEFEVNEKHFKQVKDTFNDLKSRIS
jgi:hypothetical protein